MGREGGYRVRGTRRSQARPRGIDDLDAIFRRESGQCIATLIRAFGDIDLAEDAVAEAFVIAAAKWPQTGVPSNPGGWITTTARNRAIDYLRRESIGRKRQRDVYRLRVDTEAADGDVYQPISTAREESIDIVASDQLRLMFLCAHPTLGVEAQVALTLRLLGGLKTSEIAKALVVPEATLAQRIVRAKRKLGESRASFHVPNAAEFPERLQAVLTSIYLIYTEGHTATSGLNLSRTDLAQEAIRLGRTLATLLPDEGEVSGLLALMILSESRRRARVGHDGAMVRLADQDRTLWDRRLISEGHELVRVCLRRNKPGPFQIQAAIAAVHADASTADTTDWCQIVSLYDDLYAFRPDPIVALNRSAAIGELRGPLEGAAALAQIDPASLDRYQPYHATRADLLRRAGRPDEAAIAYDRAIELTANCVERDFLVRQRATCNEESLSRFSKD